MEQKFIVLNSLLAQIEEDYMEDNERYMLLCVAEKILTG